MSTIQMILHPTDLTDNSEHAFRTACAMAKDYGARLLVLHVVPPAVIPVASPPPDPFEPVEVQKELGFTFPWPESPESAIAVEHRVAEGDPPAEILRLAAAEDCDLIVIGTHGRIGLRRLLTGSVAEEVLRKATCPVLVVKPPLARVESARSDPPAKPGEIVSVRPFGTAFALSQTATVVRTNGLEITRLVLPPGEQVTERKAFGPTVFQCIEGRVALTALGRTRFVEGGELAYVPAGEGYTARGIEHASLLRTVTAVNG